MSMVQIWAGWIKLAYLRADGNFPLFQILGQVCKFTCM